MSWLCSTASVNKIHKLNHCHICSMILILLIILIQTYFRNGRHYAKTIFMVMVTIINTITLGFIIYCYVNKLPLELNDILFYIVCWGGAFNMLKINLRQDRLLTGIAEKRIEINFC